MCHRCGLHFALSFWLQSAECGLQVWNPNHPIVLAYRALIEALDAENLDLTCEDTQPQHKKQCGGGGGGN